MREIKLRILDKKKHESLKNDYDMDIRSENNLYVVLCGITDIQKAAIELAIEKGTYRICRDDDCEYVDVAPNARHEYDDFEDYFDQHKSEYMGGNVSDQREHKRIHDGLHDIIHYMSKALKGNNVTATTTLLLQFGAYEFYRNVSMEDFEVINNAYFNAATSAFDHKKYFDGSITKMLLSRPANAYANSRAVILDVTRKDKQITFYQTDFVFKTLENIHRIGFEGTYARFGYELLLALALSNSKTIDNIGVHDRMHKLSSPTIDEIKLVIANNNLK